MSGCYEYLNTPKNVAAFVVVYGYVTTNNSAFQN